MDINDPIVTKACETMLVAADTTDCEVMLFASLRVACNMMAEMSLEPADKEPATLLALLLNNLPIRLAITAGMHLEHKLREREQAAP